MFLKRSLGVMLWLVVMARATAADSPRGFILRSNGVVAFTGGSDVASAQYTGHLEAILAVQAPGVHFRNFGWEGDTVFVQRRDVGFPPMAEQFKRAGVSVLFLQFGRAEALDGRESVSSFYAAYEKLATEYAKVAPQIVLVTPAPFERSERPLPDLSTRNARLAEHVEAIRTLGTNHQWPVVNMFTDPSGHLYQNTQLTSDGLQFTPRGHALIAEEFERRVGLGKVARLVGAVGVDGSWSNQRFEQLRQIVIEKNRLWFNYWRPQNWAFLGGDRVSQPSSRDHRDPKVRWFPAEMEKYVPLIAEKEREIEALAAVPRGAGQ